MSHFAWVLALAVACKSGDAPTPARGSAMNKPAATDPWADDTPKALPPPKVTHPFEKPFVWTAKKDGKTTYLFGTLHGGVNAEHRIPLWVWAYFDKAPLLIEEANLQSLDIVKWTVRPDGPTLHQELGDAYWAKLEAMVTPRAAGFLDTQATAVAALRVSGYGGGVRDRGAGPMDGELLVRAQGLGKKIEFLETGDEQSKLFGDLFDLATLKRLLDRGAQLQAINPQFISAYVDGDDARLNEVASAQLGLQVADAAGATALRERLLLARNRAWIDKLVAAHAAGGTFVAVGALHLVGAESVVELLRARGFTVERATPPSP